MEPESEASPPPYDMIPLDLRNRSVGRRGKRGTRQETPPPVSKSAPKTKTRTKTVTESSDRMVLDFKMLLLLLIGVLVIYFLLFSYFLSPSALGGATGATGATGGDVTRAELMKLLSKHQTELDGFLKDAEKKQTGQADALRASLPSEISAAVKSQLQVASESVKSALSKEQRSETAKLLEAQRVAVAELKKELSAQIAPLVKAEVASAEQNIRAAVNTQVKEIEHHIISSLPQSEQLDLRKKDYALSIAASSETFRDFGALSKQALKVLGFSLKLPNGPGTTLEPFVENQCWAFAGSQGFITVNLRERIKVGSVSLHMTKDQLSFVSANSPKQFDIFGISASGKETLLGKGTFDAKGSERQTFAVSSAVESTAVTIRFRSNHGAKDFTCVQKLGVHAE